MDHKLIGRIAVITTVCACALDVHMEKGSEMLLKTLIREKGITQGTKEFQFLSIMIIAAILLVTVILILKLAFDADHSEEDEE